MQIDNNKRIEIKAMEVVAFILEQYDKEQIDKDIDLCAELVLISKIVMTRLKKRYNLDFKRNNLIEEAKAKIIKDIEKDEAYDTLVHLVQNFKRIKAERLN